MQIVIKQDRLEQLVEVGELLDMQAGDLKTIVSVMSRFVIGSDGAYLPNDEGLKLIRKLKITELKNTADNFSKTVLDVAVPPQNASDSAEPSLQEQQPPQVG